MAGTWGDRQGKHKRVNSHFHLLCNVSGSHKHDTGLQSTALQAEVDLVLFVCFVFQLKLKKKPQFIILTSHC